MDISSCLREICGRKTTGRDVPADLKEYSCFVADAGYCIMCVPEVFADKGEEEPEMYCIPLPEKYVIEKGYRFLSSGIPCVDVEYSPVYGAIVEEKYDTWR